MAKLNVSDEKAWLDPTSFNIISFLNSQHIQLLLLHLSLHCQPPWWHWSLCPPLPVWLFTLLSLSTYPQLVTIPPSPLCHLCCLLTHMMQPNYHSRFPTMHLLLMPLLSKLYTACLQRKKCTVERVVGENGYVCDELEGDVQSFESSPTRNNQTKWVGGHTGKVQTRLGG